jgi:cytochrome c biogenesis protein CcdA
MLVAIVLFLILAALAGGVVTGLRWWHQCNHSIEAVGVAFLVATALSDC